MNMFNNDPGDNALTRILLTRWKIIITITLTCMVLAYVYSMFQVKRYCARTAFFIPYDVSVDKIMEMNQLGYDVEADRVLQIIGSEQVKDSVANEFSLARYFHIDTTGRSWPAALDKIYHQRITAYRTNIMSIVVQAETDDPQFSARIAAYVVKVSERIREKLYRTNTQIAEEVYHAEYMSKKNEVDSIASMIDSLRKGNGAFYPLLSNTVNSVNASSSPELEILTQRFISENSVLNDMKQRYENARNINQRPVTRFMMIDDAYPVYTPVYPRTGFMLLLAGAGSFLFLVAFYYLIGFTRSASKPQDQ